MITSIIPKLPFIKKDETVQYYLKLGFSVISDYDNYVIVKTGNSEIHFFEFKDLNPNQSDFMIYLRVKNGIDDFYKNLIQNGISIHPNGKLEMKPWKQKEFSLTDPNGTLLTFGQNIQE